MELLENDWYEIKENMLIDQVILKIDSQKKKQNIFLSHFLTSQKFIFFFVDFISILCVLPLHSFQGKYSTFVLLLLFSPFLVSLILFASAVIHTSLF